MVDGLTLEPPPHAKVPPKPLGVLGIPLLVFVFISRIYQDSNIVKFRVFGEALGEDDYFGPKEIKNIITYSIAPNTFLI